MQKQYTALVDRIKSQVDQRNGTGGTCPKQRIQSKTLEANQKHTQTVQDHEIETHEANQEQR